MIEKFEFKGLWYLPDNPENELEGTLVFDPEGKSILDLLGSFKDFSKDPQDQKIILGFTTKGKKITLFDCFEVNRSMSFPGISTTSFEVINIFEGEHFLNPGELKFNNAKASLAKLEEWVNIWGFKIDFNAETKYLNTSFNLPEEFKFKINESLHGSFSFMYRPDLKPKPKYQIEQVSYLNLKSTNDIEFDIVLKYLFHFKLLLTLGLFEDTYFKEIEFTSSALSHQINDETSHQNKIKFYFSQGNYNKKILNRGSHDFLFNLQQIRPNFESIIQKWFILKESIQHVIDSLFSTFLDNDEFVENKFLNIVQALELYHRRVIEDTDQLKIDFQSKLDPILLNINDLQKKWLIGKLIYKHEPNLRTRLKFLFKRFLISPLSKIIENKRDLYSLIDQTVCSRNYYTHYDEDLKSKALKEDKMFLLTEKLRILLILIILSEIGFSNQEIENLFTKHEFRYFNYLINKPGR